MTTALPLIAPIYLYTKFYLNANNSFKVFARQGTGQTDGQSGDYMLPLGEQKKKDQEKMQCNSVNIRQFSY